MIEEGLTLVPGDYITRHAWEDRYPKGADLQTAARDSVIRFALHYGLEFQWIHDQYGERWKHGVPQRIYGWTSWAVVTGRVATTPARL